MKEQALQLDPPNEIHFKGPYTEVTTSYLHITNPTNEPICYKIKTTAPKAYCVRPNGGIILPQKSAKIVLMLQPLDLEAEDRSKDKFMVQSAYTPDITDWSDTVWQNVPPHTFMNAKLKCVFDFPAPPELFPDTESGDHPKFEKKTLPVLEEPKVSKNVDVEVKIKEMTTENAKLHSELHYLVQENSYLKEEGLRSRMAHAAQSKAEKSTVPKPDRRQPPPSLIKSVFTPVTIVVTIVVLAFGVFVGKVIL